MKTTSEVLAQCFCQLYICLDICTFWRPNPCNALASCHGTLLHKALSLCGSPPTFSPSPPPSLLPSDDDVLLQSGEEDVIIAGVPVVLAIHHGLLPMAHPQAAAAPAPAAPAPRTFALLDES